MVKVLKHKASGCFTVTRLDNGQILLSARGHEGKIENPYEYAISIIQHMGLEAARHLGRELITAAAISVPAEQK